MAISVGNDNGRYWPLKKKKKKKRVINKGKKSKTDDANADANDTANMVTSLQIEALSELVDRVKELEQLVKDSDARLQVRIDVRSKEVKQEITEDLVAPLTKRLDRQGEQIKSQNDAMLAQLLKLTEDISKIGNNTIGSQQQQPRPFNRFQGNRFGGGKGASRFGAPRQPIVCFKCNKPGHIFRNCPELDVALVVGCKQCVDQYEQGGTDHCTVAHLHEAFDPDEMLDKKGDMVGMFALDWCKTRIKELCGAAGEQQASAVGHHAGKA